MPCSNPSSHHANAPRSPSSDRPPAGSGERGCVKLNIRFTDNQFADLARRAASKHLSTHAYVRELVRRHVEDQSLVIVRVGRQVLFSSLALHRLLLEMERHDPLKEVIREAWRGSRAMELHDAGH